MVLELAERVIERPDRLVGGRGHRRVDPRRLGMDRDRGDGRWPAASRLTRLSPSPPFGAVDVRDMDLDMGEARSRSASSLLADPLLEPGVGARRR